MLERFKGGGEHLINYGLMQEGSYLPHSMCLGVEPECEKMAGVDLRPRGNEIGVAIFDEILGRIDQVLVAKWGVDPLQRDRLLLDCQLLS